MRSVTGAVAPALHAMCIRCATETRTESKRVHANVSMHRDAMDKLATRLCMAARCANKARMVRSPSDAHCGQCLLTSVRAGPKAAPSAAAGRGSPCPI